MEATLHSTATATAHTRPSLPLGLPCERRGISGGQKRRLTCGELLVGGRELLFLDEISTGEAASGRTGPLPFPVSIVLCAARAEACGRQRGGSCCFRLARRLL